MADPLPFVCPICQRITHNPHDAEQRFCAVCGYVDDVLFELDLQRELDRDDSPEEDADG